MVPNTNAGAPRPQAVAGTHFFLRLCVGTVVVAVIFVLTQTVQIFPGAFTALLVTRPADADWIPVGIEAKFIETVDGERIEVWRRRTAKAREPRRVSIIFHGNGETLNSTAWMLPWLNDLGWTVYSFDYRGYGRSSGWPSEAGLYHDSDAVVRYLIKEEGVTPAEILPIGVSVGSGLAAYVAATYGTREVALIAPYTSLPDLVSEIPLIGLLSPFLWYRLPTLEYLQRGSNTRVVIVHGTDDTVIPYAHGERIAEALGKRALILPIADAGHNDLFRAALDRIGAAIVRLASFEPLAKSHHDG